MLVRIVIKQEFGRGQNLVIEIVDDGLDHLGRGAVGLFAVCLDHDVDGRTAFARGDVFGRPEIGFFGVLSEIESCHRALRKEGWRAAVDTASP
ncbi:hypothetical protein D3C72_2396950 [compost metagenome]